MALSTEKEEKKKRARSSAQEKFILLYYNKRKWERLMLHPFGEFRENWGKIGIYMFVLHTILFILDAYLDSREEELGEHDSVPEEEQPLEQILEFLERSLQLFCILEIVVNFRTGYYTEEGELVMKWEAVAKRYITSWFFIDLSLAFPWFGLLPSPVEPPQAVLENGVPAAKGIRGAINKLFKKQLSTPPVRSDAILSDLKVCRSVSLPTLQQDWEKGREALVKMYRLVVKNVVHYAPFIGEEILEAERVEKIMVQFVRSAKGFILLLVAVKLGVEKEEELERNEHKAAIVLQRLVQSYLRRREARKTIARIKAANAGSS